MNFLRMKRAFNMKRKMFSIIVFKELSLKQIKQIFLEGRRKPALSIQVSLVIKVPRTFA